MRLIQIALLFLVGTSMEATAGPRSGGSSDGGGGRLAQVSAGIATATGGGGARSGSRGTSYSSNWAEPCISEHYKRRVYDGVCVRRCPVDAIYRASDGACVRRPVALVLATDAALEAEAQSTTSPPNGTARVAGYFGAQKVFESDGAIALELAISDRRLRLAGGLTRFYEEQSSGDALTLTMPSLALGVRIDDSASTRVYLEGGAVGALTKNDPMMADSSITGALGGVYAEHALSKRAMLVGGARVMAFQDDVRATSLRAGIRYRHVQASFSVLDFNVGPALYGPEIGVGF
jgi:hypothetical protein